MVVPSLHARATVERQQREFTDGWDPLFIGYSAAVYFHTSESKINSWATQTKKMRGSMPPNFEDVLRTLEEAGLENKLPIYDDGRIIVEEGHMALKDDMKFARRKYRAPYGLEELELRQDGKKLNAAGSLYVFLNEDKNADPTTPPPLSVGTPGDKRSLHVENRFREVLEREQGESGEGKAWMKPSVKQEKRWRWETPDQGATERYFTTKKLLQDLSGKDWANTATPPLESPGRNLELPLMSETSNMEMLLLSAEERKKNTFEGNKWMFLDMLDEKAWQDFLSEFNQRVGRETKLEDFKEELWSTVMKFGKPALLGTGLDEKARKELLEKMISLMELKQKTEANPCKDSSTLNEKTDDNGFRIGMGDKNRTSNMIKNFNILKAREEGGKSRRNKIWIKRLSQ